MTHPIEASTARIIADLRNATFSHDAQSDAHFSEGVYLSWGAGDLTVALSSEEDMLVRMTADVREVPDWFTLNIALDEGRLEAGDVLGLVLEISGAQGHRFTPVIRTLRGGEIHDCALRNSFEGRAGRSVQTLLHTLDPADPVVGEDGFHTLMTALPKENFSLSLHDLQIFVVPATRGLRSTPHTVSSAAT